MDNKMNNQSPLNEEEKNSICLFCLFSAALNYMTLLIAQSTFLKRDDPLLENYKNVFISTLNSINHLYPSMLREDKRAFLGILNSNSETIKNFVNKEFQAGYDNLFSAEILVDFLELQTIGWPNGEESQG